MKIVELLMMLLASFFVFNWLYGWVNVLKAEWSARRNLDDLPDPGEPVDTGVDPLDDPKFRKKVEDARWRLSQGGISPADLRLQQERLSRLMRRGD